MACRLHHVKNCKQCITGLTKCYAQQTPVHLETHRAEHIVCVCDVFRQRLCEGGDMSLFLEIVGASVCCVAAKLTCLHS